MLTMNQVTYSYRKRRKKHTVLQGVDAAFEPGKVYSIFGPSGAGKTTCLCLLGGLDAPQEGAILLDGTDIRQIGYSKLRKHQVSYLFQDYHLFSYLTAVENVTLAASISGIPKEEYQQEAVRLLLELGIDRETMNRPVSETSGGQQQRIALARALISDPTYILADEPTGNLDHENALHVAALLTKLAHEKQKCVIIATHSDAVRDGADIRLRMSGGKLQAVVEE